MYIKKAKSWNIATCQIEMEEISSSQIMRGRRLLFTYIQSWGDLV